MPRPARSARAALVLLLVVTASAGCSGAVWSTVDGARAQERVVRQVGFGPRIPGTPGHAVFRAWLTGELRRLGGRVVEQSFTDSTLGRPLPVVNILARWSPAPGRGAARRILLCAHYDSRPFADQDPDTAKRRLPIAGADDGASGVAVLLEVAELLAKTPPPCEVELAFFDAEDLGRADHGEEFSIGARGYAARLGPDRPVAAFLFDMVGDRDLDIHVERISRQRASNLVDLVLDAARATHAAAFHADERWEIVDDHLPLLDAGIPAVDVIDFDYPAWHTTADTPERTSAASLAQVARVAGWRGTEPPLPGGR